MLHCCAQVAPFPIWLHGVGQSVRLELDKVCSPFNNVTPTSVCKASAISDPCCNSLCSTAILVQRPLPPSIDEGNAVKTRVHSGSSTWGSDSSASHMCRQLACDQRLYQRFVQPAWLTKACSQ